MRLWWRRAVRRARLDEAARAVESATRALEDAENRAPEAAALRAGLRRMRDENHFALGLENMLRAGYEGGHRGGRR